MRVVVVVCLLSGCGFSPTGAQGAPGDGPAADAPPDAPPPPVQCGDLTCDPHATCVTSSADATCACAPGYSGDGFTCTDIDECANHTAGCLAACQNTSGSAVCYAPPSCADLAAHGVTVNNSSHTLYLDGDPTKPYTIYCAGAGANAKEYLSLTGTNQAMYAAGGNSPGAMDVKTMFSKIRFVADQHKVDISDLAFTSSTGSVNHSNNGTLVTAMPYAVAMDCKSFNSDSATALIDLTGTHFALTGAAAFAEGGNHAGSSTTLSNQNQQATLTGGGYCGWNAPAGAPFDPFTVDATDGVLLTLVYH